MAITDLPSTRSAGQPRQVPTVDDPAIEHDIQRFEEMLTGYLAGEVEEDVFRVFRLTNGIYGQRQGEPNQMVRVKIPYGSLTPEQFEMLAYLVDEYSRGWGHITTRQNIQFHYAQLEKIPEIMRFLGSVGMTTREACGDTVRNVQACHLAGACPHEVLDVTQWAEAAFQHFLRNPIAQRMPRKFKINFSGCATDCGQAMFNDVGVIATERIDESGQVEAGFRVFVAGGLGANPHPALALEPFTSREMLLPTMEAILRVFDQAGNRDNKLRARMKWLIDTLGWEEVQARVLKQRKFLPASSSYPGGIPAPVIEHGDAPAGRSSSVDATPMGQGTQVTFLSSDPFDRWEAANVIRGEANGKVSAIAYAQLGDLTSDQFRAIAAIQREFGADVRITNRQNIALRELSDDQLRPLFERLREFGLDKPGAELARDVVSCPGADTCNLAVTQSRGLAKAIGDTLEDQGLGEVTGVRFNISGCTNSCGQHHIADIGFSGAERRAHGESAPGYQMLLGGYVGGEKIEFGDRALRLPAKAAPEAAARVVARFSEERESGESFRSWMDRVGGARKIAEGLSDLAEFPLPTDSPDFYVDFDETSPYAATVGESECAT
ncbi:MAG: nitrite/sulfite reductase [Acidimicrobiia bacterium]|nr:nitrite/sulfite reductase [Acidimicrobiia bacterium]MBP8182020.1 nitrite/sulfite reductase [Acidimicrobiia bacterium]